MLFSVVECASLHFEISTLFVDAQLVTTINDGVFLAPDNLDDGILLVLDVIPVNVERGSFFTPPDLTDVPDFTTGGADDAPSRLGIGIRVFRGLWDAIFG